MMAELTARADCSPPVAVGTSNLAVLNFPLDRLDGVLPPSQVYDVGSLLTEMVEIEDDDVVFPAVNAPRFIKQIEKEQHVSTAQRACFRGGARTSV